MQGSATSPAAPARPPSHPAGIARETPTDLVRWERMFAADRAAPLSDDRVPDDPMSDDRGFEDADRLTDQQQVAVDHDRGHVLIVAGAGTGKTTTLAARLAALVARGV